MKSMKFRGTLTPETLAMEYEDWVRLNGQGRSHNDLRFGQCIANHYLNEDVSFPELFNTEKASDAYNIAVTELYCG